MTQYLLELFMEEIPARMQERAAIQLKELFEQKLALESIDYDGLTPFVTPRRLGVSIEGLPKRQEDRMEEKRGPRVGASEKALQGFLQSAGASLEDCKTCDVEGKGTFYFLSKTIVGQPIEDILQRIVLEILQQFQWPKSMRWGSYAMSWVRPLRSILSLLDGKVLSLKVEDPYVGIGDQTFGHRFLSPQALVAQDFETYKSQLLKHHVVVDRQERSKKILDQIQEICTQHDLIFKEDPRLLQEVVGLVEWPVVLLGKIDDQFMTLPAEVLETTMRTHQKYFSVLNQDGTSAPYFLMVSNMKTEDQGAAIIHGNERVLRARLSDAQFFWMQDQKSPLETWSNNLKALVFHEKIGSVAERLKRLEALAAKSFMGDSSQKEHGKRAALLSKSDLVTGMVGEFPELQGVMGGYYAQAAGEDPLVSQAIREHYSPMGPSDFVPSHPVSVSLSLADKIDTLVSFWAIGIQPTGSKDPYALRRNALGVIRLIFENKLSISLLDLFSKAYDLLPSSLELADKEETVTSLKDFFAGRLRVFFKGNGFEADHIDAVVSSTWQGDIYKAYQILGALSELLCSKTGQDLIVAYKRAANMVDQAERGGESFDAIGQGTIQTSRFELAEETQLHEVLERVSQGIERQFQNQPVNHTKIMESLAILRPAMDAFFDKVTVQSSDPEVRTNRLNLLHLVRTLMESVADFSKISLS